MSAISHEPLAPNSYPEEATTPELRVAFDEIMELTQTCRTPWCGEGWLCEKHERQWRRIVRKAGI